MRHLAGAIAIASSLLLLGLAAFLLPIVEGLVHWDRDPFDRFEVIAVEGNPGSRRYAVTYRYHHADSSRDVLATWVLPDPPPIGSTGRPPGSAEPVLVWTSQTDVIARGWSEGRLSAAVAKGTDQRPGKLSDCYFEYASSHLVCFDPSAVRLVGE